MKNTVYILHGWAVRSGNLNEEKWQPFIEQLKKKHDLNVIFLQIPGLSAPLDDVWDLDDFVAWARKEIKKTIGNDKAFLLGHSFGGQIAIRLTAQSSDMVSKLVLVDSAGIRDMALKQVVKRAVFLFLAKVGKLLFQATFLRDLLYKLAKEGDYKNAPPLLRRTMSKVLDDEVLEDLPKIKCPTKIVWGTDDRVTPFKHAQMMLDLIPNSELSVIEGARHSPQFTHASETAKIIGEFLK